MMLTAAAWSKSSSRDDDDATADQDGTRMVVIAVSRKKEIAAPAANNIMDAFRMLGDAYSCFVRCNTNTEVYKTKVLEFMMLLAAKGHGKLPVGNVSVSDIAKYVTTVLRDVQVRAWLADAIKAIGSAHNDAKLAVDCYREVDDECKLSDDVTAQLIDMAIAMNELITDPKVANALAGALSGNVAWLQKVYKRLTGTPHQVEEQGAPKALAAAPKKPEKKAEKKAEKPAEKPAEKARRSGKEEEEEENNEPESGKKSSDDGADDASSEAPPPPKPKAAKKPKKEEEDGKPKEDVVPDGDLFGVRK